MSVLSRFSFVLSTLAFASLLQAGCDARNTAGALGAQPLTSIEAGAGKGEVAPVELPAKPGPGGVTPTLDPSVDPLHDPSPEPIELPTGGRNGIEGPKSRLPWQLDDPAAKGGCVCRPECATNDDGTRSCITICRGTGPGCE